MRSCSRRAAPRTLALLAVVAVAAGGARARTWHVPADAPTIQAGIDSAAVGDVVAIAAGTYLESGIQMKRGITLRGDGGGPEDVILDGQGAANVVWLDGGGQSGATRFEDLTFTGADSTALACTSISDLTIARCHFRQNQSDMGGAGLRIDAASAPIDVRNCVFADNSSDGSAGAVGVTNIETVRFERCLFTRNHAGMWGAVLAAGYTSFPGAILDQCTITGNTGAGYWTSVFLVGWGNITLTRSIVAHNEVQFATTGSGHLGFVDYACSDLFANAGDDYTSPFWGFDNGLGNFSADPCFCDPDGGDFSLAADSWCLPGHHSWDGCEDLVGAFGEGCPAVGCAGPLAVEPRSWSAVRGLFD